MKKYLFTLIALSLLAGTSCEKKIDTETEMKALSDKVLEVWNTGNLSLYDTILSPECVLHIVDISEDIIGIEAHKENVSSVRTSYPDFNVTTDELIFTKDKLVTRWTLTGTNTGPSEDLPPTGKQINFSGVTISHVVDGMIIEHWMFYNQAAGLIQLGYTITPPEVQIEE